MKNAFKLLGLTLLASACTTSMDKFGGTGSGPSTTKVNKKLEGGKVDSDILKAHGAGSTPNVQYRIVTDPVNEAQIYQEAQRAQEMGDVRQAEKLWGQYLQAAPTGQFVDQVSLRIAKQLFERNDFRGAAQNYSRVALLDPPSRFRGQAYFGWARAERAQGNTPKALELLAKIDFREIPTNQREDAFNFWSSTSGEGGRWLESTLASIKAYWEARDPAAQRAYAQTIREQVDRRLVEGELHFVLGEYPNRFPSNEVRVRLATLYLARGEKSQSQTLLNDVLSSADMNSPIYAQAKALLDRLSTFSQVSGYKIGALLPLSGRQATLGRAVADGLALAFQGKKVELVLADSGPSKDSLKTAFDRLVLEDRVMMIVGPLSGDEGEMVAKWSVQSGIPNVNLSSRAGLIEEGAYVFRTAATPEKQVRALVRYSREKLGAKRFAVLFPEDSFGEAFANEYFNSVRMMGGEVTAAESYDPKQTDFKILIENMIGTAFPNFRKNEGQTMLETEQTKLGHELTPRDKARIQLPPIVDFDVLFIPDTYRPLGQIIPALLYADISQPVLMGPSTWRSPQLLSRAGQYLNNAIFVDSYASERQSPVTREFVEQFQIKNGALPNALSAVGYDVGLSINKLYSKGSQPSTREELRARLEDLGTVDGVLGKHIWNSNRDTLSELQLFRIQRGNFVHQGSIEL
ncbi:MAG: penicillin-binding protein activator [Bdellovibrionota bacterium]